MTHSSMIAKLPPLQFDFRSQWLFELKPILRRSSVEAEFQKLKEAYVEMMQFLYEDGSLGEDPEGYSYLQSQLHLVDACGRDLHWLRKEAWEASDLSPLSLAIAKELYPTDRFEIIEMADIHSVVTNQARTIVFDMVLHDQLSAWESLIYAGEIIPQPPGCTTERLERYRAEKFAIFEQGLAIMKADIENS
jgi:hypothetical protein